MSFDKEIASTTRHPYDVNWGIASSSFLSSHAKAISNSCPLRRGKSMNFRNSTCLLQEYVSPFHSISLPGCRHFAIVVKRGEMLGCLFPSDDNRASGVHQSRTTGWRVGW